MIHFNILHADKTGRFMTMPVMEIFNIFHADKTADL